jgi:Flp pilus assembly protein TadD
MRVRRQRTQSSRTWAMCMGTLLAAYVIGCISGCAGGSLQPQATAPASCESSLSPADNTRLASIEQQIADGKFYAALAQLDSLGATSLQTDLVRAEALRRIDQNQQAKALYLKLEGSCLNGMAQHGLGLIAAREGRQADALVHLRRARQAMPTDLRIRNDLGYALLLAGDLDAAQFEFLTVLDLNPGDAKAGRNLVLLTFKQGQPDKAQELGRKLGLDSAAMGRLQLQAQSLPPSPLQAPPAGMPVLPSALAVTPGTTPSPSSPSASSPVAPQR